MTGPIRRVDHVYVELSEPQPVFEALTGPLGLPTAWPYAEYGGAFASGGVYLGDLILETVSFGRGGDGLRQGIALTPHPDLPTARTELTGRGIPVDADVPFHAGERLLWTNADLPGLSGPGLHVFVCEYALDARAWWDRCAAELAASGGGAVRVRRVEEIVVASPGVDAALHWARVMPFAEGPSLRIEPGAADARRGGIASLRVRADDPAAAEAAFAAHVPAPLPLVFTA